MACAEHGIHPRTAVGNLRLSEEALSTGILVNPQSKEMSLSRKKKSPNGQQEKARLYLAPMQESLKPSRLLKCKTPKRKRA